MNRKRQILCMALVLLMAVPLSGCARQKELERITKTQAETIMRLNEEIARLNSDVDELARSTQYLEKTRELLQQRLKEELAKGDLTVSMQDKGLVVSVLNKILFDSGKTDLKSSARSTLTKVGDILREQVPNQLILIEGHTDTDPIVHSGFKSNWELSTARATEVVHYFVDESGVSPERLVAQGFGEFHPVASNLIREGKAQNRRVEIVISPRRFEKQPFQGQTRVVSTSVKEQAGLQ